MFCTHFTKNTGNHITSPFLEEPLPKLNVRGTTLVNIVTDFHSVVQGSPVAGDAIVHLEVNDEHQCEEDEERADCER